MLSQNPILYIVISKGFWVKLDAVNKATVFKKPRKKINLDMKLGWLVSKFVRWFVGVPSRNPLRKWDKRVGLHSLFLGPNSQSKPTQSPKNYL